MPSNFDALQKGMFNVVKNIMAFPANWTASDNSSTWEGLVLFKNPTEKLSLSGFGEYDPNMWEMEYQEGDFSGLKDLVDGRSTLEIVTIDGVEYYVKSVAAIYDGKTYKAILNPVE